ncbi:hypothetical protein MtrunA17_Chr4g0058531 [Medicago truncatula]|uniref:Transmembrane protein n=1 Tax=Medicago truncatula TaxID=3880 RepID=A0A396IF92_MEDTR|nr:hypothetical protein MtrunA17_Chr4g0058531 [Medicago truncatula]
MRACCQSMTRIISIITITTLLVTLAVFYFVFNHSNVPFLYMAVTVVVASVMILSFRAIMVIWITLFVLLTFAGNRRKVLVQRGRRITLDVVWHLVRVLFRSNK